jgi:hypothetical protein
VQVGEHLTVTDLAQLPRIKEVAHGALSLSGERVGLDLATLLPLVKEAVAAAPPEKLPGLSQFLASMAADASARIVLAAPTPAPPPVTVEPDRRVRVEEAAAIIGCSVRWLRQHGHTLPSYRRDLNGRRVTWLRSALLGWMQGNGA